MLTLPTLSSRNFDRLSRLITDKCGIRMPESKKTMVQGRLQKRVRMLKIGSLAEYCDYLFSPTGMKVELPNMIDAVTTNKTDFFREPAHFEYLVKTAIPELMKDSGAGLRAPLRFWSAGCSSGEEPYTLAMLLSEFGEDHDGFQYSIFASDISNKVLDAARLAVYNADKAAAVSFDLKRKYFLKNKDSDKGLVRIAPALRSRVRFQRLNFADDYTVEKMDVIFCRNVLIYFDREVQKRFIERFCRFLRPGGYLFIGHSETLNGMELPLKQAGSSIYRKQ